MGLEKAEGVVLRVLPQGETSKLVHLYTLQHGRLALIAKGARLPKSRFGGSLDVCNRIGVVYYWKETRDLQFLSQAEVIESFSAIQSDIARLTLAEQCFELLQLVGSGEGGNARLYALVLDLLRGLDRAEKGIRNVARSFRLHLLEVVGFRPNLEKCSVCGRSDPTPTVVFEIDRGGYVCGRCRPGTVVHLPATGRALEWARWLQKVPPSRAGVEVAKSVGEQLDRWLQLYLNYHVEGAERLRSVRFLERLSNGLKWTEEKADRDGKEEEK